MSDSLVLRLEGFDGPLDLLLDLARAQKVDLAKISILSLVEQYLAVIEGARRVRLELAADWLVMAAWLTWLKSRLLLPADALGAEEAEDAAEILALRLRDLSAIRAAAAWLGARPQLGQDVFARGAPEDHTEIDRSRLALDLNVAGARLSRGGAPRHQVPPLPAAGADAVDRAGRAAPAGRVARHACPTGPAWSGSCRSTSAARPSGAPPWRARCWPAWKWPAAARCACGRRSNSGRSWCAARQEGVEEGA